MMVYGWEGEKVRLVPLDIDKHLDNAVQWINDPRITEWLLVGDFPLSRLAEREWLESAMKGGNTEVHFAIETLEGEHIGFSGVHFISFRHGTARTGSFIGSPDNWNKGYGTDAAIVRARYCFDILGLRMLYSEYLEGNERSAGMQRKTGYVEYGRVPKKYWKHGAYRDEILTYLDRATFEAKFKP